MTSVASHYAFTAETTATDRWSAAAAVYAATVHWLGVVSAEISDGAEIYLIKYIC
jgi:hypothetical protein